MRPPVPCQCHANTDLGSQKKRIKMDEHGGFTHKMSKTSHIYIMCIYIYIMYIYIMYIYKMYIYIYSIIIIITFSD